MNLKKVYLNRIKAMPKPNLNDYHMRKMKMRLHEEFDKIWVKLNNNEATESQWHIALNKWLNSEKI
jgi:hypothetical protein